MKTLSYVFAFLFISMLAMAGDYELARTKNDMPGGGTGTNVFKIFCNPPTSCSGCEVIEILTYGGGVDTATVVRVTGDGAFTNSLCTLSTVVQTLVSLSTNNVLCESWGYRDFLLVTCTQTNSFKFGTVQRLHQANK
jgi:hypothetical protein